MTTALGNTTYGDISQRTAAYAAVEMLDHAEPQLVVTKFALTKPMPKNKADTIKFRRPIPFDVSTVPLQEGVTPSPQKMAYEDVTAQLRQYGNYTVVTDWIEDVAEDPVLRDASMLLGEQAGATNEQIVYNAVKAGTNVVYNNGAARTDVNTAITLAKLRSAARQLYRQKAKPITRILDSSPEYGVSSVEAAYIVVCHSDCVADVRGLAGFTSTADYGSRRLVHEQEFGAVEDFRFVKTADLAPFADAGGAKGSMKSTSGTSADVYPYLIFGMNAFATVPLKGENSMTPIVVRRSASIADPLAQRGTVGYKFATTAVILNELWMLRLEAAVTA